jgi:hypothetical protein
MIQLPAALPQFRRRWRRCRRRLDPRRQKPQQHVQNCYLSLSHEHKTDLVRRKHNMQLHRSSHYNDSNLLPPAPERGEPAATDFHNTVLLGGGRQKAIGSVWGGKFGVGWGKSEADGILMALLHTH